MAEINLFIIVTYSFPQISPSTLSLSLYAYATLLQNTDVPTK